MTKIPKRYQFAGERKIMRLGSSTVVTIPAHIIEGLGLEKGDSVDVYFDGGTMLVDLGVE